MKDFFFAAWPWVACGLMVAVILSSLVKHKGAKKTSSASTAWYIASSLMYSAAVVAMVEDGEFSSDSITWMCFGSAYLAIGAGLQNKTKATNKKGRETDNDRTKSQK